MVTFWFKHCPELQPSSAPFSIAGGRTGVSRRHLDLFETLSLPGSTGGQLAFVGGPAYALDWHLDGVHLAVGVHRSARPVHQLTETYDGAGHIQIWRARSCAEQIFVSHLIPHNGDCVWDLKWRPRPGLEGSTLAAALADGQLMLYHPVLLSVEDDSQISPVSVLRDSIPQMTLRGAHETHDGIRTVQWSPDGDKLAAGTVHGCIELYRITENSAAEPQVVAQLIVRVRAHESAISTMRWLDSYNLCSAGFDGTQRVRDVRDCLTDLERVSDGPAWNLCLVNPEENIIISGADSGFLKISRLASTSATLKMSEMKKTRVAIASLRDLACMPYKGMHKTISTALFLGGGEGKLAVGSLLYPLWRASGCMIRKSRFRTVLQWAVEHCEDESERRKRKKIKHEPCDDKLDVKSDEGLMEDELGNTGYREDVFELYHVNNSSLVLHLTDSVHREAHLSRKPKSKKIGYESVPVDINLCADRYDQRVAITRLALTRSGKMIATGTHAGFLTVLPVSDDMIFGYPKDGLSKKRSAVPSPTRIKPGPSKKRKLSMQIDVKRKRGRPRKYAPSSIPLRLRRKAEAETAGTADRGADEAVVVSVPLRLRRKPQAAALTPIPLRVRIRPEREKRVRKETARKASYMASLLKPRTRKRNAETAL